MDNEPSFDDEPKQYVCAICRKSHADCCVTASRGDVVIWKMCFGCYNAGILWAARQAHKETK